MSAATINALFQWIISFLQKIVEKFNELTGLFGGEDDSAAA